MLALSRFGPASGLARGTRQPPFRASGRSACRRPIEVSIRKSAFSTEGGPAAVEPKLPPREPRPEAVESIVRRRAAKPFSLSARMLESELYSKIGEQLWLRIQYRVNLSSWFDILQLPNTFNTWYCLSVLHIWLVHTRLRLDGKEGQRVYEEVGNFFWPTVEEKLVESGVTQGLIFNKNMKILYKYWYGHCVAYDDALARGDSALAEALWRNIWGSQLDDLRPLRWLVEYVRVELASLQGRGGSDIMMGKVRWVRNSQIDSPSSSPAQTAAATISPSNDAAQPRPAAS